MLTPPMSNALLAFLLVGLLAIASALLLASRLVPTRRVDRWAIPRQFSPAAPVAAWIVSALTSMAAAGARDVSGGSSVVVEVLVEDGALRDRAKRRVRTILARCIATMGVPPANCAVLLARTLERDGKRIGGCVERLACPDGTTRTIIWLAIEDGQGAHPLDTIAARLAGFYPIAIGAERTLLIADAPPVRTMALALAMREANPGPLALVPPPVTTGVRRG